MSDHSDATLQLHLAIIERNVKDVKSALDAGADLHAFTDDGYSPLAFLDDTVILKLLLDAGADPNHRRPNEHCDVLYWASFGNHVDVVRILIAAGARVEHELPGSDTDLSDWESSVHCAVGNGNTEVVEVLLNAGGACVLNRVDYVSHTPLMIAVERGDIELARLLIKAGSDVNVRDEAQCGDTALKRAAESQGVNIVKLLLDAGADPRIPGGMGMNAIDAARNRQGPLREPILALLQQDTSRR